MKVMRFLIGIWTASIWISQCMGAAPAFAEVKSDYAYIYHAPESENDKRYAYHWEILKKSLEMTEKNYGPFSLTPSAVMSENRQIEELKNKKNSLNVMIREASTAYEKMFNVIRIPIDKDLISYRVFLIRAQNQSKFSAVKTLEELQKFSIGQGDGWGDVDILRASQFKVVTNSDYENLFKMLIAGRFDAFSRGVAEVVDEYNTRKISMPDLRIEDTILFYYPLPTYFWFPQNEHGKKLADRVEAGMLAMIKNGTYDKIFFKYYEKVIAFNHMKTRKLFKIKNPFLSAETPFQNRSLWYDPLGQ